MDFFSYIFDIEIPNGQIITYSWIKSINGKQSEIKTITNLLGLNPQQKKTESTFAAFELAKMVMNI